AIIGMDVATEIYGASLKGIENSNIRSGTRRYKVIGGLQCRGSSNIFSGDNLIISSVSNDRRCFNQNNPSFQIGVEVAQMSQMEQAIGEATGTFRTIRDLHLTEANNFYIAKNDNIAEILMNSIGSVKIAAIFIGFITLFGSA